MGSVTPYIHYEGVIFHFLKGLVREFKLSEKSFAEVIQVSQDEAKAILRGTRSITIAQFMQLSRTFKFSVDAVSRGLCDMRTLVEHQSGNLQYLSERYSKGAFSKKFNAINVFNSIALIRGPTFANFVQEYVNAGDNIYRDPNGLINVQFFCDIFDLLKRYGVSDQEFVDMGKRSVDTAMRSNFGGVLCLEKSPKNLFRLYFDEVIRDLEKNNRYKIIKIDSDHCIVDSLETEEVCDLFSVKHIGSKERCAYRLGGIEAATRFIGFSDCKVTETRCSFDGHSSCRFHISYANSARISRGHTNELLC